MIILPIHFSGEGFWNLNSDWFGARNSFVKRKGDTIMIPMFKRNTKAAVVATMILASAFGTVVQAAETLNFSSFLPARHWLNSEVVAQWAKDVEKATNGEVKINILKTPLGKGMAHFDMARDGVADVTLTVAGYTPGRFVLTMAGGLPNISDTTEGAAGALWRAYETIPEVQKEFDGVKPLAIFTTTGLQFWNSRRPIRDVKDFSGLKVHLSGAITTNVAKSLKATPVLQPISTAYQTLSNGVVDSILFTINGADAFKFSKVLSYGTLIPGGFTKAPFMIVMNPAKFKSLSKKNQEAVMSVSGESFSRRIGRIWANKDKVSLVNVKKGGVDVDRPKGVFLNQIRKTIGVVTEKWLAEVKRKRPGFDGDAFLTMLRANAKAIIAENK